MKKDSGYAVAVDKEGVTLIIHPADGEVSQLTMDRQDVTNVIAMLQHALTLHDQYMEEQGDAG